MTFCLTVKKYEVAFMLSIHDHLKSPVALAEIANMHVTEAVVFEGHPNTELNYYSDFVKAVQFSKSEKIANLQTSVFDKELSRPLWILYK